MSTTNLAGGGTQMKTFEELICSPYLASGLKIESISLSTVSILLSITAVVGNSVILVALHKESSLHLPSKLLYRCLATTDLLVGLVAQPIAASCWLFMAREHWIPCRYANTAAFITSYVLCGVSLLTIASISVDRLLALLLGLRYRQIVTLKRTNIIVTSLWVLSLVASLSTAFDHLITFLYGCISIPLCLFISLCSYSKIFLTLKHHQAQVQDHVQPLPSRPNAVNIRRYKKAVYSALWVQLAFVVCCLPYFLVEIVISQSKRYSSHLVIMRSLAALLVYFNSTLNPFLYCWKISEVRQAVKQTIRQAFGFPQSYGSSPN